MSRHELNGFIVSKGDSVSFTVKKTEKGYTVPGFRVLLEFVRVWGLASDLKDGRCMPVIECAFYSWCDLLSILFALPHHLYFFKCLHLFSARYRMSFCVLRCAFLASSHHSLANLVFFVPLTNPDQLLQATGVISQTRCIWTFLVCPTCPRQSALQWCATVLLSDFGMRVDAMVLKIHFPRFQQVSVVGACKSAASHHHNITNP